jgi:hypothetical protein
VTDSGQLDLEALMAQVESQQRAAQAERPEVVTPAETVVGGRAGIPSMELPPAARRAAVPPVRRSPPPPSRRPGRDKIGRRPQRPSFLLAAIIAAILSILLVLGVLVSAFALGLHPLGQTSATPTATAIPTMTPSPSPSATQTTGPSATATLTPQQIVNNEAAAAFASVTLATFDDPSCSRANQTTRFSSGQWVYINLCTSSGPIDGLVTVAITQGGTVVHYMANSLYLSPNASYYYYEQFVLSSGSYHMLVTMPINGKTAVARDLVFTVS